MSKSVLNPGVAAGTALLIAASMLTLNPAAAQSSGACIDTDNDGWGWDGSQSCIVGQSSSSAGACVDEDGDGWGWDGQNSCRIGDSDSSATSAGSTSAECVDDDGDGWGWNGSSSCQLSSSTTPATNPVTSPTNTGANGFNSSTDLVALHFDHAPDRDDGHAAAAALAVTTKLGLNVQVVGGTYGVWSADRYVSESEQLMNSVWGSNWLNAHSNRELAVAQATNRWVTTIAAGGDVWIAEGGPSDFTVAVINNINSQFPEIATAQRIHLVQHSVWNEDHTLRSSLDFVRGKVRYIKIEDGNEPNSTADFRQYSQSFVDGVLASQYTSAWRAAFGYLSPNEKLDFSDTVELLYIVGIGVDQVKTVDDFAREFIY